MRSRYDLAEESVTTAGDGTKYKDIFTIPVQKFTFSQSIQEYTINSDILKRPDYLCAEAYDSEEELDDVILLINNIGLLQNKSIGDEIDIPSKEVLENYYYKYRQ